LPFLTPFFILSIHQRLGIKNILLYFGFKVEIAKLILVISMRDTCPIYLIHLDLSNLTIKVKVKKVKLSLLSGRGGP
jgi:hypothetical protein